MPNLVELFDNRLKKLYHFAKNRIGLMKRYYISQMVIDICLVIMGVIIYLFPSVSNLSANMVFYTMMVVYAGLELCEYVASSKKSVEGLYLFFASGVAAFSGFFLKVYPANMVLSITLVVWLLLIAIIKIIGFEKIYKKKTHLFTIKIGSLSAFLLLGILISINIYYRISTIGFMLALLYLSYGGLELFTDGLEYLSDNTKFLSE